MSGVQMIRDNTQTCLNNLERSLDRCNSFLTHRCIPKECVLATAVSCRSLRMPHVLGFNMQSPNSFCQSQYQISSCPADPLDAEYFTAVVKAIKFSAEPVLML